MLPNHVDVVDAIHSLNEVSLTFPSADDGGLLITRRCAPMDYGPARITKPPEIRYHFWDFESDSPKNHTISLRADMITSVEILTSTFDPASFVTWKTNWHIARTSWGPHN